MSDFYASQYENAGPIARPVIQRSQYLADALRAIQASGEHIRSGGELGTRLLAAALTQYAQRRNQRQLQNATEKDSAALNQPLLDQLQLLSGGSSPAPSPPGTGLAPNPQALAMALGMAQPPTSAPPTQLMGEGSGVGAPGMQSNRARKTDDALIRLLVGEDRNPTGQQAVANVALNRAGTGMDLADVITQPHQFEPYTNQRTWQHLQQIPQTDPRYQQAAQALAAARQQDITGGATNFYGPESQRALAAQDGRPVVPGFAQQGGGQMIGGNEFFRGQFAPPAGYQPPLDDLPANAPPPPPPAGAPPAVPPTPSTPGPAGGLPNQWGLPPAVPQQTPQPAPPQVNGMAAIPPMELQYIRTLMANPDPRAQAQGRQMLQGALARAMQVPGYHTQLAPDGVHMIYTPDNPAVGEPFVRAVPGLQPQTDITTVNGAPFSVQHGNAAAGLTPMAIPPQAMNRNGDANQFGLNAPPGTNITVNPLNVPSVVTRPQEGYSYQGGRSTPLAGGSADVSAPQNAVPALIGLQQHVQPLLDTVTDLNRNINAARAGFAAHNGAGDVALINGLQHLTDTGIVRQEDINNQIRGFGLPGTVQGALQFLHGGGQFTDQQRQALLTMAQQLYTPAMQGIRSRVESYRPIAERIDPQAYDTIVSPSLRRSLGWEPQPGQPGIDEVARRLREQVGQVGQHVSSHRRVIGVTQVGP